MGQKKLAETISPLESTKTFFSKKGEKNEF
jgi:hypothetical protein